MPATRPANSISSSEASPISAPPMAAESGVKLAMVPPGLTDSCVGRRSGLCSIITSATKAMRQAGCDREEHPPERRRGLGAAGRAARRPVRRVPGPSAEVAASTSAPRIAIRMVLNRLREKFMVPNAMPR